MDGVEEEFTNLKLDLDGITADDLRRVERRCMDAALEESPEDDLELAIYWNPCGAGVSAELIENLGRRLSFELRARSVALISHAGLPPDNPVQLHAVTGGPIGPRLGDDLRKVATAILAQYLDSASHWS